MFYIWHIVSPVPRGNRPCIGFVLQQKIDLHLTLRHPGQCVRKNYPS